MENRLSPSILSADFGRLYEDVKKVEAGGAHLLHVDVMDGHFVPNITIGPVVLEGLQGKTRMPLDVHLMIENPDRYIENFIFDNTEIISVHQEACPHLHRSIQHIKSFGVKAGVAINPATSLRTLDEILDQFPQLSNEAVMACRFMGAAILRDTQRWLSQRDYWDQRKQAQPAPSYARKKVPGMVPDPGREVRQESPEEYHRKLEKLAQMARQA